MASANNIGRNAALRGGRIGRLSVPALSCALALGGLVGMGVLAPAEAHAQGTIRPGEPDGGRGNWRNLILPQHVRPGIGGVSSVVRLTAVDAEVEVRGQVAVTTIDMTITNRASGPEEAQVVIPVPEGATIRSLQYDGTGPEPTGRVMSREEARRIYEDIVRQTKDPALLEFVGFNLIRTSVFPVPAGASQHVRVTYEQVLEADGARIDYALARSESFGFAGAGAAPDGLEQVRWSLTARIDGADEGSSLAGVYSPSHDVTTERVGPGSFRVRVDPASARRPGPIRLSILRDVSRESGLSASFIAYPESALPDAGAGAAATPGASGGLVTTLEPSTGGYFLLLANLPRAQAGQVQTREVTIVLDRSGSMRGEKMEQAKEAAVQVIEGLREGEWFNVIDYSDSINSFSPAPVRKDADSARRARDYVSAIQAGGGTNIGDALAEALRPDITPGTLAFVLFLTDGLPTVGERSEVKLRAGALAANRHARRVFSFGVGYDVNSPLLSALASGSRGVATFVLPEEDVEVKVSSVFRRLTAPVLASPTLSVDAGAAGMTAPGVREVMPGVLGDVFDGDQVIVAGRFVGEGNITLRLAGQGAEGKREFVMHFDTRTASPRNAHVARLWATRRIGALVDSIRQSGAEPGANVTDPAMKELVDEIVRLSVRFGVLTEYTAFLALEPGSGFAATDGGGAALPADVSLGVPVAPSREEISDAARERVQLRVLESRSGQSAVNQDSNVAAQTLAVNAAGFNSFFGADMKKIELTGCQQVNDMTLFRRSSRWVDARMLGKETEEPESVVEFASDTYFDIVQRLAAENRQGVLAMGGDCYLLLDGKRTLVRGPAQ